MAIKGYKKREAGFSLLEIIVVLTIIGILGVVLSTGLIRAVESFVFASEATQLSQKAQMALARIKKELIEAPAITQATANYITYIDPDGRSLIITNAGGVVRLGEQSAMSEPNILIDNVDSNTGMFQYTTETVNGVATITSIGVVVVVRYGRNETMQFRTTINRRKTDSRTIPALN